jgi:ribosomal RNA-processing protein 9
MATHAVCHLQVLAVDALRAERVLTSGQDHTCRVWKVPEESQLIFRYTKVCTHVRAQPVPGSKWLLSVPFCRQPPGSLVARCPGAKQVQHAEMLDTRRRGYGQAIDCVAYVTGTEWVSGSSDGGLALWSQLKKKPVRVASPPTTHASMVPMHACSGAQHMWCMTPVQLHVHSKLFLSC